MKKLALLIPIAFLFACTSPESLGKEAGQLGCEAFSLAARALNGDSTAEADAERLKTKAEGLERKIDALSEDDKAKARAAMQQEAVKCLGFGE